MVSLPESVFAIDVEQDHHIFWVEFRSVSFQRPIRYIFLMHLTIILFLLWDNRKSTMMVYLSTAA